MSVYESIVSLTSLWFCTKPCIIGLVYNKLRIYLHKCSHESVIFSPCQHLIWACLVALLYLKAVISLACDRFPLIVQLWPWIQGHPMVPRHSSVEYCFPCRHAQLIRQKDHAAAPKHSTIGCLFWWKEEKKKKRGLNPFLKKGVMWVWSNILRVFAVRFFCNWSSMLMVDGGGKKCTFSSVILWNC